MEVAHIRRAPKRYKIQFTVGRETYDKLRRAQDLLRHVVLNGDPAMIFERAGNSRNESLRFATGRLSAGSDICEPTDSR